MGEGEAQAHKRGLPYVNHTMNGLSHPHRSRETVLSVKMRGNVFWGLDMASFMANVPALKSVHQQLRTRMEKSVEDFRANLLSVRTGRASVHMLDQVKVDYYGTETP